MDSIKLLLSKLEESDYDLITVDVGITTISMSRKRLLKALKQAEEVSS